MFEYFICLIASQPLPIFSSRATIVEELHWNYLTHISDDTRGHIFSKGNTPKMNVLGRLGFEVIYFEAAV